jgi:adenylate cyclase
MSKLVRKANHLLRTLHRFRTPLLVVASLLVFGATQVPWLANSESLVKLEGQSLDTRFRLRRDISNNGLFQRYFPEMAAYDFGHPKVALVGITQRSLDQGLLEPFLNDSKAIELMASGAWPFPRATYAYVLDRLFELGAKTVAMDILFASNREGDEAFNEALKRHAGKVVLARSKVSEANESGGKHWQIVTPNSLLAETVGPDGIGFAFFEPDKFGGVVRRLNLRTSQMKESDFPEMSTEDDWIRFAPLAVSKFLGQPPAEGRHIINYQGGAGTFHVYPIEELFSERLIRGVKGPDGDYLKGPDGEYIGKPDPSYEEGNAFKDKLVFLGPIAETMHDEHSTPLGYMPGVEIHAQLAAALLANQPILELPQRYERWIVLGLVSIAFLLLLKIERVFARLALGGAVVGVYILLALVLFWTQRLAIPIAVPMLAMLVISGSITALDFAVEQLERAHVRSVLDKYVSSNVASLVIGQGDSFETALRGVTKPVSVLFSDIRSFTTWSESCPSEQLVAQLNEYFLPMVDKVLTQGGTLQKFIGDAIMAVWGDTHSLGLDVDARGAVRAAIQMREALKVANAGWRGRPDRMELSTGIGINHGRVVVGEVGHPQRMEFTVLGDGVNLAARLESSTKQFGCDILVGETAEALTRDHFVFRRIDRVVFKGKTEPIDVFTPMGETGILVPDWLGRYHGAIDLYRNQEFQEAKTKFGEVLEELGGQDFMSKWYQKRCDHFMAEPPAPDWNGSWVLSEK